MDVKSFCTTYFAITLVKSLIDHYRNGQEKFNKLYSSPAFHNKLFVLRYRIADRTAGAQKVEF